MSNKVSQRQAASMKHLTAIKPCLFQVELEVYLKRKSSKASFGKKLREHVMYYEMKTCEKSIFAFVSYQVSLIEKKVFLKRKIIAIIPTCR